SSVITLPQPPITIVTIISSKNCRPIFMLKHSFIFHTRLFTKNSIKLFFLLFSNQFLVIYILIIYFKEFITQVVCGIFSILIFNYIYCFTDFIPIFLQECLLWKIIVYIIFLSILSF